MFSFKQKEEYLWNFPSNNNGQIWGISDSGVETFLGKPIKSLAREICQNSLDAHLNNDRPVQVDFSLFEIKPEDIPDVLSLKDSFSRALDFWSLQKSDKAKKFFKGALNTISQPILKCLRISDFNTTGLIGSKEEYNSPWSNLIKSSGASDKAGSYGGSFGIGKYAPFSCSALRTVIYSTADKDGICACQGVSRLTSFKNKDGQITQGTGFYGNKENTPIYSQKSLDPDFSRPNTDYGTDIFILGFNGDTGWQEQMIASILDGFLYAVYSHVLIATVDGIEISSDTLPDLVISHKKDFQEHADEYYQTLIDNKTAKIFEKEIKSDPEISGKLTLKLMIMPEFHRRVAMIRQTGMKIKDKGNINGLIPFSGVLYIEGNKINEYLRGLENPQHLEWEIDRAEDKNKARKLLRDITRFIKDSLNEMKNDDSEEALDPSVGEYLSAPPENDISNQEENEALQDTIKNLKVRVSVIPPIADESNLNNDDNKRGLSDNDSGDIEIIDFPGEGGSGSEQNKGNGGNGGGQNPGEGGGGLPSEHRNALSPVLPINVRNVIKDKEAGKYTIIFTPKTTASDGCMEIFMSAESQNYEADILFVSSSDCPDITINGNIITNISFVKNKPLRINIQLDYHDYCSLEVKAYGNKE